jgi:hypothetical protein
VRTIALYSSGGRRLRGYDATGRERRITTPHDHNPVNDALGNVEAFERLLNGER